MKSTTGLLLILIGIGAILLVATGRGRAALDTLLGRKGA